MPKSRLANRRTMRVIIAAIGKLKSGAEHELVKRYFDRIQKSGKSIGITKVEMIEVMESRAAGSDQRKEDEASSILSKLPSGALLFCFDERGASPSSRKFANQLESAITKGAPAIAFIVGGPDGLSASLREKAENIVSFGALTMPHQIVRALVVEQIYRAVTILSGHPYHRD